MNKTFYLTFSTTIIVMTTGGIVSTLSSIPGMPAYILILCFIAIPFTLSALSAWIESKLIKRNSEND